MTFKRRLARGLTLLPPAPGPALDAGPTYAPMTAPASPQG